MAVGKWLVDASFLHPVKVYDKDGTEGTVWLRELSENDVRKRSAGMIQFDGTGGDMGEARIQIEKLRQYEMEASIADWDFEIAEGEKLPVTAENIGRLPQSIADRVHDEIGKLNELPQDRFEKLANGEEKQVEHPTTDNSGERSEIG